MISSSNFLSLIRSLLLPANKISTIVEVTNNLILKEIIECFEESIKRETVGTSVLFNMHYIIIMHPEIYEARLNALLKIVEEAIKVFYRLLKQLKAEYENISPIASNWSFKFAAGEKFNNDIVTPFDLNVIGSLTSINIGDRQNKHKIHKSTKVTIKLKATNIYDKFDLNVDAFRFIDVREPGSFEVKFDSDLALQTKIFSNNTKNRIAEIKYYISGNNEEGLYVMQDKEVVIARKEETNKNYSNYLLLNSPDISNPHARIRFNEARGKFQIASFSRNETRVNESIVPRSFVTDPQWYDLHPKSQILLNTLVTLEFQSYQ